MSEQDFWDSTLRAIYNRRNGFHDLEEMRQRQEWERTRWQTAILATLQVDKKNRTKLDKALKLPWDDEGREQRPVLPTEQDLKEFEKYDRHVNKKFRNGIS